jgi:hypothetical protein
MRNQYKQKTKVLGIPVIGYKDGIWPELEMKKWTIVENMLLAGLKGMKNCIFEEGDLSIIGDKVILQATGESGSVEGIVGGAYFKGASRIEWYLPKDMTKCLLYLKGTTQTHIDPSIVRTAVSSIPLSGRAVLSAAVDVKNRVLDRNPDGKVVAGDIARHMSITTNPHGEKLVQDEIEAGKLTVAGKDVMPEVVELKTAGKKGIVLTAQRSVSFAQVCRCGKISGEMGEVSVGYYGSDKKAVNPEDFVVYNSGDTGVSARALIF